MIPSIANVLSQLASPYGASTYNCASYNEAGTCITEATTDAQTNSPTASPLALTGDAQALFLIAGIVLIGAAALLWVKWLKSKRVRRP